MFQRIQHSLAFRTGPLYRQLLAVWPAKAVTKPVANDLRLMTMSGKKHALMLEQMLWTLSRVWERLPLIRLLSDGTLDSSHVKRVRTAYAGPVELIEANEHEQHHEARGRPELVEFGRSNCFGRKLACIVAEAELGPTLWVDNDVLFYGDFSADLGRIGSGEPLVGCTRDASFGKKEAFFGYDTALAAHLFGQQTNVPALNAGFCFARGNFYDQLNLAEVVRWSLAQKKHGYLTEQTIVAAAAMRSSGVLWDEPLVHMDDEDIYSFGPTYRHKPWKARHYTGNVRHLFWRDAFFTRFSKR